MNFNFTKGKVIGTLILAIIIDIAVSFSAFISGQNSAGERIIGTHVGMFLFGPTGWTTLIVGFVLIYIIWSLFQKKN